MKNIMRLSWLLFVSVMISACTGTKSEKNTDNTKIYKLFKTPETSSKLFVRWWWNGDKLSEKEILRELDVMKAAGIGGVEINPIKFQPAPDPTGYKEIEWLSEEWLSMVKVAVEGAKERGIICDMIVGSGWPFGAEYLSRDEQSQITTIETTNFTGPLKVRLSKKEIMDKVNPQIHSKYEDPVKEIILMRLVPKNMDEFTPGISVDIHTDDDGVVVDVPAGDHVLYSVVKITGFMAVINGAKGAGGPVLNHYNKAAVEKYLDRMFDALKKKLGDLGKWFRAFFVDSLELEGANWCDDLFTEFKKRRGYDLEPYYPFILNKIGEMGNVVDDGSGTILSPELKKIINRVRYDFEITRTELFKERFLDVLIDRTKKNNVKLRVQGYGRGYQPIESGLYIDIPENETWFNSQVGIQMPEFNSRRPYSMSNKFVSSSAHLSGKRLISCEEITNTGSVFNATLEQIKLTGDLSNLSGVTHSILHGFNYSPPEVPFPGWVQYGTYFNEQNTWWKYFPLWSQYKARISGVFQNSTMQADIAILHPIADLWTNFGAQRDPFPKLVYPEYAHNLWEAIHQSGSGCDYISESIIQSATYNEGALNYGHRSYKTLMLMEVETIQPGTVKALEQFVKKGGKLVMIGKQPHLSPGLKDYEKLSRMVSDMITEIKQKYPGNVFMVDSPTKPLLDWYRTVQKELEITPYVSLDKPDKFLSQVYYKTNDLDIFFFSNSNKSGTYTVNAEFTIDLKGKVPWIWDPETGERYRLPADGNRMTLTFLPSETQLIVFDSFNDGEMLQRNYPDQSSAREFTPVWKATLRHANGKVYTEEFNILKDLSQIPEYIDFAGEIDYEATFNSNSFRPAFIDLGEINGVSELYLNGTKAGVVWYGLHQYNIGKYLQDGENKVKITVTTTLGNYCKSLVDNPVCQRWTRNQPFYPCGMVGPVRFLN